MTKIKSKVRFLVDNVSELIIADEPAGELDSKTAKEIIALLFDINAKEKTVDIADAICTIPDGKLKLES